MEGSPLALPEFGTRLAPGKKALVSAEGGMPSRQSYEGITETKRRFAGPLRWYRTMPSEVANRV